MATEVDQLRFEVTKLRAENSELRRRLGLSETEPVLGTVPAPFTPVQSQPAGTPVAGPSTPVTPFIPVLPAGATPPNNWTRVASGTISTPQLRNIPTLPTGALPVVSPGGSIPTPTLPPNTVPALRNSSASIVFPVTGGAPRLPSNPSIPLLSPSLSSSGLNPVGAVPTPTLPAGTAYAGIPTSTLPAGAVVAPGALTRPAAGSLGTPYTQHTSGTFSPMAATYGGSPSPVMVTFSPGGSGPAPLTSQHSNPSLTITPATGEEPPPPPADDAASAASSGLSTSFSSSDVLGAEGGEERYSGIAVKGGQPAGARDTVRDGLVFFSKNFQIVIKGGTLEKLIERLTFDSAADNDYIDTFLLTYRTHIASSALLAKLLERYDSGASEIAVDGLSEFEQENSEKKQKIIRLRVGNVIKRWLTDHFHDFSNDPTLVQTLFAGLENMQERGLAESLKKLTSDQLAKTEKRKNHQFSTPPPASVVPKTNEFEDFDSAEIARQLCLHEWELYISIHPKEALNQAWNKKKENAPNILKMITWFNSLSKWVATQVVAREDIKLRSGFVRKLVQIIVFLRQYNNFNAMQAILAGLGNSAVHRLKHTWAKVEDKEKAFTLYGDCKALMDSNGNFSNYRKIVGNADPPIIPYLGVYLTDLTFIEDGNKDYLKVQEERDDIINFEKMRKVAVVIKDICTYQQTPYNFTKVDGIFNFFQQKFNYDDDNTLFQRSRKIEPPDMAPPKDKKGSGLFRKLSFKDPKGESSKEKKK